MSTPKDRTAARIAPERASVPALVPDHLRAAYADELARIPQVRIAPGRTVPSRSLPAVGSFYD